MQNECRTLRQEVSNEERTVSIHLRNGGAYTHPFVRMVVHGARTAGFRTRTVDSDVPARRRGTSYSSCTRGTSSPAFHRVWDDPNVCRVPCRCTDCGRLVRHALRNVDRWAQRSHDAPAVIFESLIPGRIHNLFSAVHETSKVLLWVGLHNFLRRPKALAASVVDSSVVSSGFV